MKRISAALVIAAALWAISPGRASAHPHVWIDVWVEVLFDASGAATGLRQTWLFDDFYSAYAVEGLDADADGAPDADKLEALLRDNIKNLAEFDYFTRVNKTGNAVALAPVVEMSSRMKGRRLEMTFVTAFAVPQPSEGAPLVYEIFDPTYYIEMVHAEEEDAIRLVGAPLSCRHRIAQPDPNPDIVALAAGLDRDQTAGDGLGAFFAEQVSVRCGGES